MILARLGISIPLLKETSFKFSYCGLLVIGLVGIIIAPRLARAEPGNHSLGNFLETIGVSTGAGAVLGAATMPFYDEPFQHTSNVAIGAGAGLITGLGILIYQLAVGSHSGEDKRSYYSPPRKSNPWPTPQKVSASGLQSEFFAVSLAW